MAKKSKAPAEIETVTVTMSRETAEAVKRACEEFLRLRMGQFEDFTNEVCCWNYVDQLTKECKTKAQEKTFHEKHKDDFWACMRHRDDMRLGMMALWRQHVMPASIDTTMKEAYRAESVWLALRYKLAWHDYPEGGTFVDFYTPMNRSDQPFPKVELKEKAEDEKPACDGKCAECGRC